MTSTKTNNSPKQSYRLNRVLWLFAGAVVALVPWTLWLAHTLPPTHLDRRWEVAWSGLDVGELVSLTFTTYLGLRRSGWVVVVASIAGTLLLVDAWFDTVTAARGWEYVGSLSAAVFVELPLSLLAFSVAYRVGKRLL